MTRARPKGTRSPRLSDARPAEPTPEIMGPVLRTADSQREPMPVTALFAGIGGIELGLERAGHATLKLCENDSGATAVLDKHFHGIPLHEDIGDLGSLPKETELLTAGFPCQDLSQAGRTKGITGSHSGLIDRVFRLLERKRVPWVLIENVPFMLQLGGGRGLDHIVSEFERLGYRWAYRVVDTLAFGLPQRRRRVFFLASRWDDPRDVLLSDETERLLPPKPLQRRAVGFYWTEGLRGLGIAVDAIPTLKGGSAIGIPSPPAIMLPTGRVVTPDIRDAERLQGFEEDWTLPASGPRRRHGPRWRLVGNAVTVRVAEWIGHRLRHPRRYEREALDAPFRGAPWPHSAWNIGNGRFRSDLSEWPLAMAAEPVHEFLRFEPKDLSVKAATGFVSRLETSSLRWRDNPAWFRRRLKRHIARVSLR